MRSRCWDADAARVGNPNPATKGERVAIRSTYRQAVHVPLAHVARARRSAGCGSQRCKSPDRDAHEIGWVRASPRTVNVANTPSPAEHVELGSSDKFVCARNRAHVSPSVRILERSKLLVHSYPSLSTSAELQPPQASHRLQVATSATNPPFRQGMLAAETRSPLWRAASCSAIAVAHPTGWRATNASCVMAAVVGVSAGVAARSLPSLPAARFGRGTRAREVLH